MNKDIENLKNILVDLINSLKSILNLTEKQQKELENYKNFKKDIVSKIMFWDKEELPDNERIISMLDTLMEEVSRLEDIEDKKVEVAVNCIEEKRDKFWQDKIREAIKNREIELYADNPENNFIPFDEVINTLKELLKEK